MIAYHKIKQPFYNPGQDNYRFGKDCKPELLINGGQPFRAYKRFIQDSCIGISNRSWGARLELRMSTASALINIDAVHHRVWECRQYLHWETSNDIASYWSMYMDAIEYAINSLQIQRDLKYLASETAQEHDLL
ncbi:hypothetical protein BDB00DRAFT_880490 [Zychaea mexicana]|uniref:uncharacterized protein n=1 Tax=Zychaea mexicana TaxID=64656 RepID=UPI0022FE17F4|nr:uncharacterized protein BDB00DRAFT_880490 [Zychaea mexicana]KAI9467666.1 hypothetical protein BDB00DRAFT_880490 [Zychaea mexicana]